MSRAAFVGIACGVLGCFLAYFGVFGLIAGIIAVRGTRRHAEWGWFAIALSAASFVVLPTIYSGVPG